jgi:DNA-binding YbaB/EbfC family protein
MAKRKTRPAQKRPPTLKQIQELQAKMLEAQEALGRETVSVSAGGGAIKVVMSGHQKIKSIEIEPAVLEDVEMLQDLIIAAINEAIERSQQLATDKMSAFTGGFQGLI